MFNLDDITNEHNKNHNKKWPYISDHPYRMLIIGGFGSGKANALFNLIKGQDNDNLIDKIYLYVKDLNEIHYKFLIKKCENAGIEHLYNICRTFEHFYNIHNVWMMFTIIFMITT